MGNVGGAVGLFLAYMGDQLDSIRLQKKVESLVAFARQTGLDEGVARMVISERCFRLCGLSLEQVMNSLSPERAMCFLMSLNPPACKAFFAVVKQFATHDKVVDTFKSGEEDLGKTTILAVFVALIVFSEQPMILI